MTRPVIWQVFPDATLGVLLGGLDLLRLGLEDKRDAVPKGSGPVMITTGLFGRKESIYPLERYLRNCGYDARHPDIALNLGPHKNAPAHGRRLEDAIKQLCDEHSSKVHLIGWSLGGLMSVAYAHEYPENVASVQTLASPYMNVKESSYLSYFAPALHFFFSRAQLTQEVNERLAKPLLVPHKSYVARYDGLVDPALCGRDDATVVDDSHFSIGFSFKVYSHIARFLNKVAKNRRSGLSERLS